MNQISVLTMGKTQSKSESVAVHNADPQIKIFNAQIQHGEQLAHHEVLIYVILVVVVAHLAITLYTLQKKREKRMAFKIARSMESVNIQK